jgi:hypothetical protein
MPSTVIQSINGKVSWVERHPFPAPLALAEVIASE